MWRSTHVYLFCINLAFSKCSKIINWPKLVKLGPNLRFLVNYSSLSNEISLIMYTRQGTRYKIQGTRYKGTRYKVQGTKFWNYFRERPGQKFSCAGNNFRDWEVFWYFFFIFILFLTYLGWDFASFWKRAILWELTFANGQKISEITNIFNCENLSL